MIHDNRRIVVKDKHFSLSVNLYRATPPHCPPEERRILRIEFPPANKCASAFRIKQFVSAVHGIDIRTTTHTSRVLQTFAGTVIFLKRHGRAHPPIKNVLMHPFLHPPLSVNVFFGVFLCSEARIINPLQFLYLSVNPHK